MSGDQEQRMLDLEDVALRHERLLRLLRQESELRSEVNILAAKLASAKRKLANVSSELHDISFVEIRRGGLQK